MSELKEEPEDVDNIEKALHKYHDHSVMDLSIPGAYHNSPEQPSSPVQASHIIYPAEASSTQGPLIEDTVEDEIVTAIHSAPEKRSHRSKTQYRLAHPPPATIRKQDKCRSKVLFQLQSLSNSRFHKPAYEVAPLSRFDDCNRVGSRLRRLGKGKVNIVIDDLVVLKSSDYQTPSATAEPVDLPDSRDVLGIISPLPFEAGQPIGRVKIILDDAVWHGTPLPDGKYDLKPNGTEQCGGRWYIPKSQRTKFAENDSKPGDDLKFYFAAMLQQTKKHPTLASLTKSHLDVYDSYTLAASSNEEAISPLAISPQPQDMDLTADLSGSSTREPVPLDDLHRRLVIVSSFWIMLREGWSSNYTFPTTPAPQSSSVNPPPATRSLSVAFSETPSLKDRQSNASKASSITSEHQPSSCRSSLRSIKIDHTGNAAKRLSLPAFTFGRSSPLGRSSIDAHDFPASISLDRTRSSSPSIDPLQIDMLPMQSKVKNNPTLTVDTVNIPTIDPTAQFRHLLDLETPNSAIISKSPLSKIESIIRRKSTNHNSPAEIPSRRRSRSISWNWNLSKPKTPIREPVPELSLVMGLSNTPVIVDSTETPHAQPITHLDNESLALTVSTATSNGEEEDSLISADDCLEEKCHSHEDLAEVTEPESTVVDNDLDATLVSEHDDCLAYNRESQTHANHTVMPSPLALEMDDRRSSTGSSDLEEFTFGTPYWKDFDRIQTRNFVTQAQNFQPAPMSYHEHLVPAGLKENIIPVGTSPVSTAPFSTMEEENSAVQKVEADSTETKGWFTGLRRSVHRRRGGSFSG
ncbi:hypothetical protein BT63DRAFT_409038 [Microthyrium microscopicum]|uniref:Uncharacterized protein n=1 Tax=Microthyrium microscopicum TaxID=703497 RepID=A0A6A6UTZ9_9PEZI|nr:hypothetical protein BT63DRAFT_409038 [Microthyrium microscopicum]